MPGLVHHPVFHTQHNISHNRSVSVIGYKGGNASQLPNQESTDYEELCWTQCSRCPHPHPHTRTARHSVSEILCWGRNKTVWTNSRYQTSPHGTHHQNRTKLGSRTYMQKDGPIQEKELYAPLAMFHSENMSRYDLQSEEEQQHRKNNFMHYTNQIKNLLLKARISETDYSGLNKF